MSWFQDWQDAYWESSGWLSMWLITHEVGMTKLALWMLFIGFGAYSLVKGLTWWDIRGGIDQTDAGRSLKAQKLVESVAWGLMSAVFGYALLVTYDVVGTNVWGRTVIRLAAGFSVWFAVLVGVKFILAFRRTAKILTGDVDHRQDAREVVQNEREQFQDDRDKGHAT